MSKLIYFDFRCDTCGTKFDDLVRSDVLETPCTKCGEPAKRLIATPRIALSGTDPSFPGAYDAWERKQKQKRAVEAKHYERHGVDLTFGGDVKP